MYRRKMTSRSWRECSAPCVGKDTTKIMGLQEIDAVGDYERLQLQGHFHMVCKDNTSKDPFLLDVKYARVWNTD